MELGIDDSVGAALGSLDGAQLGIKLNEGKSLGALLGLLVGSALGCVLCFLDGLLVVGDGVAIVGEDVRLAVGGLEGMDVGGGV